MGSSMTVRPLAGYHCTCALINWSVLQQRASSPYMPMSPSPMTMKEKDSPSLKQCTSQPEWRLASPTPRRSICHQDCDPDQGHIGSVIKMALTPLIPGISNTLGSSILETFYKRYAPFYVYMHFNNDFIRDVFSICFP